MNTDTPEPAAEEQKDRKKTDRRSHVDRRSAMAPWQGQEQLDTNRRKAVDRRGLSHGVFYKTDSPLDVLYDWLRDHCKGKWSVGIESANNDSVKKSVKVLFEQEADKKNFVDSVVRG